MKLAHTYFDICLDFIYLGGFLRPSLLGVFVKTHNSLCISRNIQFFSNQEDLTFLQCLKSYYFCT